MLIQDNPAMYSLHAVPLQEILRYLWKWSSGGQYSGLRYNSFISDIWGLDIFSCARFYKPCSSCRIIQKWTGLAHLILMNLPSMISSFSSVVHLCVVLGVHFSQWSGNLKEWNGLQVLMTSNICERCFDKYFGARVIEGSTQHGT